MKRLWIKVKEFIKRLYSKIVDETKIYIPIAINVVEALKSFLDSPVDDVILTTVSLLIPNLPAKKIDVIKDKLQSALPAVLLELNLINAAAISSDINEQLKEVIKVLNLLPDESKAEKYHTIASRLLVILSDGKITWSEAVIFTEWYYQTYYKK